MKTYYGKTVRFAISMTCFIFLELSSLFAQGFRNPPEGSSSIAQAGAFIAQSDDASAVTHNPAGLVQTEGTQFLLGSTFLYPTTLYRSGATSEDAVSNLACIPFFYFSTDLGTENFRFGLGISSPYGQSTEWSKDTVRTQWYYMPPYYASMLNVDISPVIAYRFTSQFSAGIGLDIYYSRIGVNYLIPPGVFGPDETTSKIDVEGTAYGGSLGLLYREKNYSIGLKYKSGFTIDADGDYKVPNVFDQDASLKMDFPQIVGIGLAVYPNPKLKIEFDVEWTRYSCLEEIPVEVEGMMSYEIEKNWDDCYMFSLGTEYKKSENVKLRAGIAYLTNPMPDSTWEPSLPGADSVVIVAGGEFLGKLGTLDISAGLNLFREREIEEGGPYDGKYSSTGYFCNLAYKKSF